MKKVAVILSGCGHLDGAEIRESILTLLELDRQGAQAQVFAPDMDQAHVMNHLAQEEASGQTRNVLQEAARLARGEVAELKSLRADHFDALVIPGGFGVAKNLSQLAFEGTSGEVLPPFKEAIHQFYELGKPIGAICIAPAIIAMVLGSKGVKLTLGQSKEMNEVLASCGANPVDCSPSEICIDSDHKIYSTPAYMFDNARLSEVAEGIQKLIKKVLE